MRQVMVTIRLWAVATLAALSFAAIPAHAKFYVNRALGDLKPEMQVKATEPKPVQIIIQFQTDGVANAKATKYVKPIIIEELKKRGVFADVVETPVASGALMNLVFNNITEKGAAKKGFQTGLTFGLFSGLFVTDKYAARFELIPATGTPSIVTNVEHALHLKMGNKKVEDPGIQVKNAVVGIRMIIDQVVAHGANQLATDPGFTAMSPVVKVNP